MAFIKMDDRDIKRFERDLKTFAARAYPFATKATINSAAFQTRAEAQTNIRSKMVTRNKWTVGSVKVEQARTLNVRRQEAVTGSTQRYMETQEFGGMKRSRGKEGVPIPTSSASGEGQSARPRKRLPTKPNKLRNIKLRRSKGTHRSRAQRTVIAIQETVRSGRRYVFLDLARHPGIYRVSGSKAKPRIHLIHDMSRRAVTIPATPWLNPAVKTVTPRIPGIYKKALKQQLVRRRLFVKR